MMIVGKLNKPAKKRALHMSTQINNAPRTSLGYFAIFNRHGDYFGGWKGNNPTEAFASMESEVGDAGGILAWNIVERLHIDADRFVVTAYENGHDIEDSEVDDMLAACGFEGATFDQARCDCSSDGEGYVFSFEPAN